MIVPSAEARNEIESGAFVVAGSEFFSSCCFKRLLHGMFDWLKNIMIPRHLRMCLTGLSGAEQVNSLPTRSTLATNQAKG